jgi:hypothetical protein
MLASVPMDLVPLFPSGRQGALHGFEGVPAVVVGATINLATLDQVCEAANWAYRERFLSDKQGGVPFVLLDPPDLGSDNDTEDQEPEALIDVFAIIKEEQAAEGVRELNDPT